MKRLSLLPVSLLFCLLAVPGWAQYNGANVWHFGNSCVLDFNFNPPVAVGGQSFSALGAGEGTSSICDANGNILFYSNGQNAWDANGNPFPAFQNWPISPIGIPLLGGGQSATNSAFIVPDPGNANEYYIFFAAEEVGFNGLSQQLGLSGISYVKVDMALNNGLGDLISSNNIVLNEQMTEKIAVTNVCGSNAVWLVCHRFQSNEFYAYKITEQGIEDPVVSATGYVHDCPIGQMKISPDGRRIACATYGFFSLNNTISFEVLEFDNVTGQVGTSLLFDTNFTNLPGIQVTGLYGVAFSMDASKVYAGLLDDTFQSGPSILYQYDLSLPPELVAENRFVVDELGGYLGQMQLGPDCKLYICNGTTNSMAVINNPDLPGALCGYEEQGLFFALEEFANAGLGLPAFNDALLYPGCSNFSEDNTIFVSDTCVNASTSFGLAQTTGIQDVLWDFGDPASGDNNASDLLAPTHVFALPGVYAVSVSYSINCIEFNWQRLVTIVSGNQAIVDFDYPAAVCNDSVLVVAPVLAENFTTGGFFAAVPGLDIDPTTGTWDAINAASGNYIITYTSPVLQCVVQSQSQDSIAVVNCIPDPIDTSLVSDERCALYLPNAFTPDNDGVNDVWRVTAGCAPQEFSLRLFNRWGMELWNTTDTSFVWTGGVASYYAADGVYLFIVRYSFDGIDWREDRGHVVVIR